MWETVTRNTVPFEGIDSNLVGFRIISGEREVITSDTPQDIQYIIQRCWKDESSERILEIIESDELSSRIAIHLSDFENLPNSQAKQSQNSKQNNFSQSIEFSTTELQKALEGINEQKESYTEKI